jgi:hypothetical protein
MINRCAALLLFGGLIASGAGFAEDESLKVEVTPYGAYRFGGNIDVTDSDERFEFLDSPSYGLIVNIRHQANTQWEVLYSRQRSDAEFSDASSGNARIDVETQILQLGGTYQGEGNRVRPYLALTVGGTRINTHAAGADESDTFWSGSIGVGLQIRPVDRIGLRLEARAYGTLMDSNTDVFCRTGPNQNVCAAGIDGSLLKQFETIAGIVFRF